MLFVCGKIPFWWVLPSGITEDLYHSYWRQLAIQAPLDFIDFLDLGFLKEISKTEFLGNALWQLSKGIKDPFKSLLKMGMMEMYLSKYFRGPLICDVLKQRVLDGTKNLMKIDPYLLMVEMVLEFYALHNHKETAELLRKAFYLKADAKMTRTKMRDKDYKIQVFRELMKK